MAENTYLNWVLENTVTKWWHDSAEAGELQLGLERGAIGVTTNPFLANLALVKDRDLWAPAIDAVLARKLAPELKAEALMQIAVTCTTEKLIPEFAASNGQSGFVCAQVNPLRAGDRDCMLAMARRLHRWAPNIAVKLPATSAKGIAPGKCFAVIMIGRLDDFLREVAHDNQAPVSEDDIRQAGLAVTKRAYALYRERGYEAVLLVAALRGDYHLTELAGADLIMSIAPAFQEIFVTRDLPREERIDRPVPADAIERLSQMPEFVRAYEPDGMTPAEFMAFGATQRTLSQFCEVGWKLMESYR
jgi:transaldolase